MQCNALNLTGLKEAGASTRVKLEKTNYSKRCERLEYTGPPPLQKRAFPRIGGVGSEPLGFAVGQNLRRPV